ncbi:hypothetical protein [Lysobacter sp. CA199]|uniref:hypothetical protein n=1 Tax=Lysobacter sp. CA199 TaxID=3455608 RepID=UPI003F8D2FED
MAEIYSAWEHLTAWDRRDYHPEMDAPQPGLIPPDVADLPALPPRFSWHLPHVKQHRRPTPESRQVVLDHEGPALASMQPGVRQASAMIGVHRYMEAERYKREFHGDDARARALEFIARWVAKYHAELAAEREAQIERSQQNLHPIGS